METEDNSVQDNGKPQKLLYTAYTDSSVDEQIKWNLIYNQPCAELLMQKFDKNKKIVVIGVAGYIGTGKSTFLNIIAHLLNEEIQEDLFPTSSSLQSFTDGVWVYPYPLYLNDDTSIQYLLVDMEGQGGISKGDKSRSSMIKKIYLLGLLLSSSFAIMMATPRPNKHEMDQLKVMFENLQFMKQKAGASNPKITLFIRRDKGVTQEEKNEFYQLVKDSLKFDNELLNTMDLKNFYTFPKEFVQDKEYDQLIDQSSEKVVVLKEFIKDSINYPKTSPFFSDQQYSNINQFIEITKTACDAINSPYYESFFTNKMEEFIHQKCEIYSQQKLEIAKVQFEEYYQGLDKQNIKKEQVEADLQQMIEKQINEFKQEVEKSIPKCSLKSPAYEQEVKIYSQTLDSMKIKFLTEVQKVTLDNSKNQQEKEQNQMILNQMKMMQEQAMKAQERMFEEMSKQKEALEKRLHDTMQKSYEQQDKLLQQMTEERKQQSQDQKEMYKQLQDQQSKQMQMVTSMHEQQRIEAIKSQERQSQQFNQLLQFQLESQKEQMEKQSEQMKELMNRKPEVVEVHHEKKSGPCRIF